MDFDSLDFVQSAHPGKRCNPNKNQSSSMWGLMTWDSVAEEPVQEDHPEEPVQTEPEEVEVDTGPCEPFKNYIDDAVGELEARLTALEEKQTRDTKTAQAAIAALQSLPKVVSARTKNKAAAARGTTRVTKFKPEVRKKKKTTPAAAAKPKIPSARARATNKKKTTISAASKQKKKKTTTFKKPAIDSIQVTASVTREAPASARARLFNKLSPRKKKTKESAFVPRSSVDASASVSFLNGSNASDSDDWVVVASPRASKQGTCKGKNKVTQQKKHCTTTTKDKQHLVSLNGNPAAVQCADVY